MGAMVGGLRRVFGIAAGLLAFGAAGAALAGGMGGGSCNCTPPPSSSCCNVPTGHEVNVPGVNITPPTVTVNSPTINISAPTVNVQSSSVAYASSSASASADASGYGSASGYGYANALAAANAYGNAYGYGGGGGWSASEGGTSYVNALDVQGVGEGARVCAEMRSAAFRTVAIQAICLDDKDTPHPASQVMADRDVLPTYEGELFRCIAGTHMQYVLAPFAGQADFGHGQTISCLKGEALWHSASGALACRPQRPARDCNERSLLRRFGPGVKVVRMGMAAQCVAWRSASAGGADAPIVFDGGVGGVVR